jgi:hypothetical protein
VKYLRPINGLKGIVYDKLGEVEFRKVITEAICKAVPSEVKFEMSHIQGSSRLCEVSFVSKICMCISFTSLVREGDVRDFPECMCMII